MFAYIQTRHKSIAGYYVVGIFSKYLSCEQAIRDRKDCAWLNYVKAPPPKFWYKGKLPVLCMKTGSTNLKVTLFKDCGFLCHSKETWVLNFFISDTWA